MPPRPSQLTPELAKLICAKVAKGITLQSAAALYGVKEGTVHDWLKRGRAGESETHADFAAGYEAALSKIEETMVDNVVEAAAGDWKASAWWLERRRPKDYAGKVAVEHSADDALQSAISRLNHANRSTDDADD
jgi:transposase